MSHQFWFSQPEIGNNKNRRKTTDGFDIFLLRLRFFIRFNKTTILKKERKCLKYVDTVGNRPMGSPYVFPTDWRPGGKCIYWVSTFFLALPKCIHYSVSASRILFWQFSKESDNNFKQLLEWSPRAFRHISFFYIKYFGLQEAKPPPCPLLLTEQGRSIHWTSFIDN